MEDVKIVYLTSSSMSSMSSLGKYQSDWEWAPIRKLIPFYGKRDKEVDADVGRAQWCSAAMDTYLQQQCQQGDGGKNGKEERKYLNHVLSMAKQRAGYEDTSTNMDTDTDTGTILISSTSAKIKETEKLKSEVTSKSSHTLNINFGSDSESESDSSSSAGYETKKKKSEKERSSTSVSTSTSKSTKANANANANAKKRITFDIDSDDSSSSSSSSVAFKAKSKSKASNSVSTSTSIKEKASKKTKDKSTFKSKSSHTSSTTKSIGSASDSASDSSTASASLAIPSTLMSSPVQSPMQSPVPSPSPKRKRNKYDDFNEEELEVEEPYTQAEPTDYDIRKKSQSSQSNDGTNDSDDDSMDMGIFNLHKCKKSNEPIRPGDVIEYWNPIFVKGSAQGKRTATVLSVDPSNDNDCSLRLSNMEAIPDTTEIRRVKTMSYRKRKDKDNRIKRKRNSNPRRESRELVMDIAPGPGQIDHPGVYRLIRDFALQKWKEPKRLEEFMEMETEAKRMGRIMEKNRKIMEKKAKKDGFAPMDMVYGGKRKCNRGDEIQLSGSDSEIEIVVENDRNNSKSDIDSGSESDDSLAQIVKRNKRKAEERKKLYGSPSSISRLPISIGRKKDRDRDKNVGVSKAKSQRSHSNSSNSVKNKHKSGVLAQLEDDAYSDSNSDSDDSLLEDPRLESLKKFMKDNKLKQIKSPVRAVSSPVRSPVTTKNKKTLKASKSQSNNALKSKLDNVGDDFFDDEGSSDDDDESSSKSAYGSNASSRRKPPLTIATSKYESVSASKYGSIKGLKYNKKKCMNKKEVKRAKEGNSLSLVQELEDWDAEVSDASESQSHPSAKCNIIVSTSKAKAKSKSNPPCSLQSLSESSQNDTQSQRIKKKGKQKMRNKLAAKSKRSELSDTSSDDDDEDNGNIGRSAKYLSTSRSRKISGKENNLSSSDDDDDDVDLLEPVFDDSKEKEKKSKKKSKNRSYKERMKKRSPSSRTTAGTNASATGSYNQDNDQDPPLRKVSYSLSSSSTSSTPISSRKKMKSALKERKNTLLADTQISKREKKKKDSNSHKLASNSSHNEVIPTFMNKPIPRKKKKDHHPLELTQDSIEDGSISGAGPSASDRRNVYNQTYGTDRSKLRATSSAPQAESPRALRRRLKKESQIPGSLHTVNVHNRSRNTPTSRNHLNHLKPSLTVASISFTKHNNKYG